MTNLNGLNKHMLKTELNLLEEHQRLSCGMAEKNYLDLLVIALKKTFI